MMYHDKNPMKGGVNEVFKLCNTIHRPVGLWTNQVHELLRHVRLNGFLAAPTPIGFDEDGLEILSFIEGDTGGYPMTQKARSEHALRSSAQLLRQYHDSTIDFASQHNEGWQLPPRKPIEVICHGDYGPHNCIFKDKEAVGIIDFDTAHAGSRMWDVAYAVYRFAPLTTGKVPQGLDDIIVQAERMRIFCDSYDLSGGQKLVDEILDRLEALVAFMKKCADEGNRAFQEHIKRGDADLYLKDHEYIKRHREFLIESLTDSK